MTTTPVTLRDYQHEAITAVREAYRRGVRRQFISLPTGCGKTIVMAEIIRGAAQKGSQVLLLAHRDELLQQAKDKLCNVAPDLCDKIGFVKGSEDNWQMPIVIASVQTLGRPQRIARLVEHKRQFHIIFTDEGHHSAASQYQRIYRELGAIPGECNCGDNAEDRLTGEIQAIKALGGEHQNDCPTLDAREVLMIGVSATPQRADNKDLGETWEEITYHRDMLSMIRAGYLSDLRGVQVKLENFDPNTLKVRSGDFAAEEAGEALSNADAPVHTVNAWLREAAKENHQRKTIVFTPTIKLAEEMAEEFRYQGVSAENISGVSLEQRRAVLDRFRSGETMVVTNAMILTEGFDEPSIECIVIARPTKSKPLYIQMVGRGTRIYPGKKDCLIMDMAGATERLDLTTAPKMFGLGEEETGDIEPDELMKLFEEEGLLATLGAVQAEQVKQGRIVQKQVDLFNRKDLSWKMSKPGFWVLGLGDEGQVVVQVNPTSNRWSVTRLYQVEGYYRKEDRWERLGEDLDLGYAMGVAEEYARQHGSKSLVDKNASWRQLPVSPKQEQMLMKWHYQIHEGMTRGEASDIIDSRFAEKRMRKVAQ